MKILIVDDEPTMADFLVETIGERFPSYWIESAVSGTEARTIAGRMDELDLLLTDIVLGDTDGFELREELLRDFPRMQTIFITGHDLENFGDAPNGKKILKKPLDTHEVFDAVTNARDSQRHAKARSEGRPPDPCIRRRTRPGSHTPESGTRRRQ